tara:strand:+ start:3330 stop:3548 length:219 start_codon:yes stop_codon:yes gene_type:complete
MQPLDTDRPAQIRQEAADRVAQATAAHRRSTLKLIALAFILGALVGLGAGVLVMDRWQGQQVIFIPANGTEV